MMRADALNWQGYGSDTKITDPSFDICSMDKDKSKGIIVHETLSWSFSTDKDEFGWWDLEIISADVGIQFTSTEFKKECQTRGAHLTLVLPEHQEMNVQVEVTCITLRTISHSLMVYTRVLGAYIHFAFMYTTDHIFPVLPIKYLINEDGDPTTPYKLANRYRTFSITFIPVIFPYVLL